jgi:TATA-box binding protein (TBP) (component of TFIID and TFIIIB)
MVWNDLRPECVELLDSLISAPYVEEKTSSPVKRSNLVLVTDYGILWNILVYICEQKIAFRNSHETFPCVMTRFRKPAVTIMGFNSGKFVSVGANSMYGSLWVFQKLRLELENFRAEYYPQLPSRNLTFGCPKNANMVFTVHLPDGPFDLARFYAQVSGTRYVPDRFPGANLPICVDGRTIATAVFFEKGAINIMGVKKMEDAHLATNILANALRPYKMTERVPTTDITAQRQKEKDDACNESIHSKPKDYVMPVLEFTTTQDMYKTLSALSGPIVI